MQEPTNKRKVMMPGNTLTVYTTLCVMKKMKAELGLEAMHEYMEHYVAEVSRHNPSLREAVKKALRLMNVKRMYAKVADGTG